MILSTTELKELEARYRGWVSSSYPDQQRLGILGHVSKETIGVILGCLSAGKELVILNPLRSQAELNQQLKLCGLKEILQPSVVSYTETTEYKEGRLIVFTSGTSGEAKGVVLSRANLEGAAAASNKATGFSAENSWLLSISPAHVGGLAIIIRALNAGGSVVLPSELSISGIWEAIQNSKPDYVSMVPTALTELIRRVGMESILNTSVKLFVLGGEPVSPEVFEPLKGRIINTYGMTETSAHFTATKPGDDLTSVGKPLEGYQIRLEQNQILVAGPGVCSYGLTTEGRVLKFEEEFFKTGDIGEFNNSNLIVKGRAGRMIISGGENIDLQKLENDIAKIFPEHRPLVVGVPDTKRGMRPALLLCGASKLEPQRIRDVLKGELGALLAPERVVWAGVPPLTETGKVNYHQVLRALRG